MRYRVSLLNTDPNLDLREHQNNIQLAIKKINSGGVNGNKYSGVANIQIICINKRTIILDCSETDKIWHMHFGKELADNYGMRDFCIESSKNNQDMIFEWF